MLFKLEQHGVLVKQCILFHPNSRVKFVSDKKVSQKLHLRGNLDFKMGLVTDMFS